MDSRITEAQRALERWSRAIVNRWIEAYDFITKLGLTCGEEICIQVGSVTISVSAARKRYISGKGSTTKVTGSMNLNGNLSLPAFANNQDFDITLLPRIREEIISTIEAKKQKAKDHLESIEKALEPLRPDIAEQVLEEGRQAALSGGSEPDGFDDGISGIMPG